MITANRLGRRNSQMLRSQVALELALTVVATVAGLALLRTLVLAFEIRGRTWSGSLLVAATEPMVLPLGLLPGGSWQVFGTATLADLTTSMLLLALPVFVLSRPDAHVITNRRWRG
jgi:hypothetical protein